MRYVFSKSLGVAVVFFGSLASWAQDPGVTSSSDSNLTNSVRQSLSSGGDSWRNSTLGDKANLAGNSSQLSSDNLYCTTNADCDAVLHGSDHHFCVDNRCTCQIGWVLTPNKSTCAEVACSDCIKYVWACNEGINQTKSCGCPYGWSSSKNNITCLMDKAPLKPEDMPSCQEDYDCMYGSFSGGWCNHGKCQCLVGQYAKVPDPESEQPTPGCAFLNCLADTDACAPYNWECKPTADKIGYCECPANTTKDELWHFCQQSCNSTADCSVLENFICDKELGSNNLECTCKFGYMRIHNRCEQIRCTNDSQCHFDALSECDQEERLCRCMNGYQMGADQLRCVPAPTEADLNKAVITVIMILLVCIIIAAVIMCYFCMNQEPKQKQGPGLSPVPTGSFPTAAKLKLIVPGDLKSKSKSRVSATNFKALKSKVDSLKIEPKLSSVVFAPMFSNSRTKSTSSVRRESNLKLKVTSFKSKQNLDKKASSANLKSKVASSKSKQNLSGLKSKRHISKLKAPKSESSFGNNASSESHKSLLSRRSSTSKVPWQNALKHM